MRIQLFRAALALAIACEVAAKPQGQTNVVANITQSLGIELKALSGKITTALHAQKFQEVVTLMGSVDDKVQSAPASVEDARNRLQALSSTDHAHLYDYIANLRALNLVDSITSLEQYAQGFADGASSSFNQNADTPDSVHLDKLSCDAPLTTPKSHLQSAIHIPSGFTFGKKPPVILFPGTGGTGYTVFRGNFIKLLQGSDFADPVWVNVPGLLLDDAQVNAEYAAYAINYIASITQQNVTVLGWSQGNINIQWAFKYFPSTRLVTTDHVAVSPDYAGTILADFISPPGVPMPASVLQQRYMKSSQFISLLRADGGDSAYVPTTTIYSGFFDEIVEPQQGTGASAYLNDARNIGVTNNEVQRVCAAQLAGSFYTHEGVLYNPLAYALLRDAMAHPGPGQVSRLNLGQVCSQYLTPGLGLGDLLVTENAVAIAGLGILLHNPKMAQELAMKAYARSKPVANLAACGAATNHTTPAYSTSATTLTAPVKSSTTTATTTTIITTKSSTSINVSSSHHSQSYMTQTASATEPAHSTTSLSTSHTKPISSAPSTTKYSYSPHSSDHYSYSAKSYTYSYSPHPYDYSYSAKSYTYTYAA